MTEMIHVQVPSGVAPRQIEGFPADCERSVKGSLHVRPGTLVITAGELEHLRKHHKDIARRFHVLGSAKAAPEATEAEAKPEAKAAPAATPAVSKPEPTPEATKPPPGSKGKHRGGSSGSPEGPGSDD
jgi:hypothetical protein